jgi:hypothetical protein
MTHTEIILHLSSLIDSPTSNVLYSITMQQVLTAIVRRMGDDALFLSADDLQLLREEVVAVIEHSLDYREVIDEGIEAFNITRRL